MRTMGAVHPWPCALGYTFLRTFCDSFQGMHYLTAMSFLAMSPFEITRTYTLWLTERPYLASNLYANATILHGTEFGDEVFGNDLINIGL